MRFLYSNFWFFLHMRSETDEIIRNVNCHWKGRWFELCCKVMDMKCYRNGLSNAAMLWIWTVTRRLRCFRYAARLWIWTVTRWLRGLSYAARLWIWTVTGRVRGLRYAANCGVWTVAANVVYIVQNMDSYFWVTLSIKGQELLIYFAMMSRWTVNC